MNQLLEFASNNLILVSAFFFVLALLIINIGQTANSRGVSPHDVVRLLNDGDTVVVDLRGKADFDAGHIINAKNISAADIKGGDTRLDKYKNKPILVYCATGTSSGPIVKQMLSTDFENVQSLKGGVAAWRSDNLPLTRED